MLPDPMLSTYVNRVKCPCNNCSDRHESCHATCDKYLDWKVDYDSYREIVTKGKKRL